MVQCSMHDDAACVGQGRRYRGRTRFDERSVATLPCASGWWAALGLEAVSRKMYINVSICNAGGTPTALACSHSDARLWLQRSGLDGSNVISPASQILAMIFW